MSKLTKAEVHAHKQSLREQDRMLDAASLKKQRQELYQSKEWYTIRALLGNTWAFFYILLGARERGKSYSVMLYCLTQWKLYKKPFTWMKLTEASTRKMLANDAAKFVDPDLYRSFGLKLKTKGTDVYDDGEKMATILALSTAHNDKGVALFDNDNILGFNIVLDEFQLEKDQKRTFDVSYNLVVQLENLVRSRKEKIRIFFIGNTTEEASDILALFNFIPINFGIYKLKSKRAVIDYMPNSAAYQARRKGTVGDILAGHTSNFTNQLKNDITLIYKKRLLHPSGIIMFTKDKADWFTVWDSNVIAPYNKEKLSYRIAMRRYIDESFSAEIRDNVFAMYDARAFRFTSLLIQKRFTYELSLIKRQ